MELIDVVRGSYGYTDEYILDKTFTWLYNSAILIRRRTHDDQVNLSAQVAKLILSKDKKLKYWDDIHGGGDHVWIEDEEEVNDLKGFGLGK